MKRCCWTLPVLLTLSLLCAATAPNRAASTAHRTPYQTLVVGWHDEFNSLEGWSPWTAFGGADILGGMDGTLRVTLGKTSDFMKAFGHYRAGVYKEFDMDLHRYPVLAVRASRFRDGASWDVGLLEFRDSSATDARDISKGGGIPAPGNPQGVAADLVANSSARYRAETIFVVVQGNARRKPGKSHVRLLLNLSGPKRDAIVDFAWVRFLPTHEVERLRNNPRSHNIRLVEQQ